MKPDRSDQVVARVVAWHNRHPLAQRITAAQVHSVGVVLLPFAVRGATRELPQPEAMAVPAPEIGPVVVSPQDDRLSFAGLGEGAPMAADGQAAADAGPADAGSGESAAAEPQPPAAADGDSDGNSDGGTAATASPQEGGAEAGASTDADAPATPALAEGPLRPGLSASGVRLPPRPRAWDPRTWWAALRGRGPFRALFTEDFIAPLRPRQVARWAAQHGVSTCPLAGQVPERWIELDASRRTEAPDAVEVDLQVITAAIGADDRRLRLLLAPGPRGAILGPRQISRPRATVAGVLAALLVIGGFVDVVKRGRHAEGEHTLAHSASAVGGSSSAASAASSPEHGGTAAASAASAPTLAQATSPASAADPHAHAESTAASGGVPSAVAHTEPARQATPHADADHAKVAPATATPTATPAVAAASSPTAAESPTAAASAASAPVAVAVAEPASRPRSVSPRRGRISFDPLVSKLGDAERQELRVEGRTLRGQPAVLPDAKAWALATLPSGDKRLSEKAAAQLHALALLQPIPMRAELVRAGGTWRAVCWPFPTAADAEKVRLALADRGLRTEVVEF